MMSQRIDALMPNPKMRSELIEEVREIVESFNEALNDLPVAPAIEPDTIRQFLDGFEFAEPENPAEVIADVGERMKHWNLHVGHPSYFGLFNPSPGFFGILAEWMSAAFNCQLGAWHHNPFGVEVESHLIRYFANRFGLGENAFGHFTSGGSEANFTASVIALSRAFPLYAKKGLRALNGQPVFYCSREFHHSFEKIAHQIGLGREAVRLVPVTDRHIMDVGAAEEMIEQDKLKGLLPFMIVGTAGTTNAGMVEPLESIAETAKRHGLHFHVDAAWGGNAILSDRHRSDLAGIERADTITMDPHKLLSVPMGAGMILVREHEWLYRAFGLQTDYVPESETEGLDNYRQSFQFSRRFIGLKLFLQLAIVGQPEYGRLIDRQFSMAKTLADKLGRNGFTIHNEASMGVVCFSPPQDWQMEKQADMVALADEICRSGEAWFSVTRLSRTPVFRACITNRLTEETDLDRLVESLTSRSPVC